MKEGTHYVFTEWKPTSILFARGKRAPIVGMRIDNAMSLRATKVFLHVGKVDAIINMPKKQNKPKRTQTTACVWGSHGKDDNDSNKFSHDRARYRSTISHERAIAGHFRSDAGSALPRWRCNALPNAKGAMFSGGAELFPLDSLITEGSFWRKETRVNN